MARWIKRYVVIGDRTKERSGSHRRKVSRPGCDPLEGRQLLSGFGGLRGGGLLALQQAQVGGLHSSSGLGGLRRHGLGGALGFTQGPNFGHFGRGRHLLFSGLGQTGLASTLVSTTAPGGAAPVQLTAAASSTIAAPAAMSSTTTATPATADSTQAGSVTAQVPIPQVMVGGATPSGPVVVSGLAGQGMPVPIAPATGWGQAAAVSSRMSLSQGSSRGAGWGGLK